MTRPAPRPRRAAFVLGGLLAMVLAWTAGFVWFLHRAASPATLPPHADAIVALTGGAERIETALRLLAEGRADRLLVSGVGGMADFADFARPAGIDRALGTRVTLGRTAASTHGNALETARWTRANGVRSLLVVTAFYHMPRALAEFQRAMPDVRLYPVPVLPAAVPLRLLASEYVKYLAIASGLADSAEQAASPLASPLPSPFPFSSPSALPTLAAPALPPTPGG